MYELGCFLYEKHLHKEEAYKLNEDKWWYFSTAKVCEFLKDPIEKKVSGRHKVYYFAF